VLRKFTAAGIAAMALGLVQAGPALADDPGGYGAFGNLLRDEGPRLAHFDFDPYGEHVTVSDDFEDDWGVLVELWWGGKLRRWCWNTSGEGTDHDCNFDIKEGRNINFFIAEAHKDLWKKCAPADGCGKRRHFWAGENGSGCGVTYQYDPALPCARTNDLSDFRSEA
jgi:hypothetical protein